MTAKRLQRDDRRRQLLTAALAVVRAEGVDALTLARVAEEAGVSKPIAYEHFGTRAGLLVALFKDYDDRTTEAVAHALAAGPKRFEDTAGILAAAYIDCCLQMGPELSAVFDALSASAETEEFRRAWRAMLVETFERAFTPFIAFPREAGPAALTGLLGAAEAMAEAAAAGRIARDAAVSALAQVMTGSLAAWRR